MDNKLTIDLLRKGLPVGMKKNVPDELLDDINTVITDPEVRNQFRENLLSYASVMQHGRFKLEGYIDAIKYCTYKLMGDTNISAYSKTFPDRIAKATHNGTMKDISSYVTSYSKTKLVNLILEQSLVPTWVLNQDLYQKALNTQAELMTHAKSEKVRCDAANSLITALKRPETQKMELDINVKEDKSIDALRASTMELVAKQKEMLSEGSVGIKDIAHSELVVEGEYEEVNKQVNE